MQINKKINPLYVVSKNGKDVESAANLFDLFLKKTGLDQVFLILESVIAELLAQVKSYPIFIEVKNIIDNLLAAVLAIIAL
jgi:hypothetical protein